MNEVKNKRKGIKKTQRPRVKSMKVIQAKWRASSLLCLSLLLLSTAHQSIAGTSAKDQHATKTKSGEKQNEAASKSAARGQSDTTWAQMKRRNENDAIADRKITEQMIKNHEPASGPFILRRRKIWNKLKRDYEEKKDVTKVMSQCLKMNETVNRGTNWIIDDKGTYTRIRPLSERCKDLEDALDIKPEIVP